jgi:glycosyltransferase involved in cell wall biosynthesis
MTNLPVYISLTTIHSRVGMAANTIERLLQQKTQIYYQVVLCISQEPWLLDEGIKAIPVELNHLLKKYKNFSVRWVQNIGPYRKLLPLLLDAWASCLESIIITCDDDVEYPEDFLQKILNVHYEHNCIVAFRGYSIQVESGVVLPYESWQNAIREKKSLKNIPTGKDGILYRTSYFDENVFNIQEIFKVAKTADDLWFKWHTAIKKIPVVFVEEPEVLEFPSSERLIKSLTLWRKFNKSGGNDEAINLLESLFFAKRKKTIASVLSEELAELSSEVKVCGAPSLLCVSNNLFRASNIEYSDFLYRQIISRNRNNHEALFNLAFMGFRKKDVRGAFDFYQLSLISKQYKNELTNLLKKIGKKFNDDLALVIIPAFNSESTLRESVESVVNQTYKNTLIVIVDDASDDSTLQIAYDLGRQYTNVFSLALDRNVGPYVACNYALDLMRFFGFGYFLKHDADDLMAVDKLEIQINPLKSEGYLFSTSGYVRISYPEGKFIFGKRLGHNMTVYHRTIFDEIGFYDDTRFDGDSEYLSRARFSQGAKAEYHVDQKLTKAYLMPGSITSKIPLGAEIRKFYIDSFKKDHLEKSVNKNWHINFSGSILSQAYKDNFNGFELLPSEKGSSDKLNFIKPVVCVAFPTFNRVMLMERLISQLNAAALNCKLTLLVFDDGSEDNPVVDWGRYQNIQNGQISSFSNHGKKMYWSLVNKIFASMKETVADYYIYLGDDLEVGGDFFDKTINLWNAIDDPRKVSLNLLNDGREECWTNFKRKKMSFNSKDVYLSQWLDMVMMVSRDIFDYQLYEIPLSRWDRYPLLSSGVGSQLSSRLLSDGWNMYQTIESHVFHGEHQSKMNPEERALNPLVSVY